LKKNIKDKTLDIGCGWGFSLKINPDFYVCDADDECIKHLKMLGYKASLVDVSVGLPYGDQFFDNAFTHDVLEHLEESECVNLFKETRRVLKLGGYFMNVVPNKKGYLAGLNPLVGHKRFIDVASVSVCAEATGFSLVKSWYTPLPSFLSELFFHNKLVMLFRAV